MPTNARATLATPLSYGGVVNDTRQEAFAFMSNASSDDVRRIRYTSATKLQGDSRS